MPALYLFDVRTNFGGDDLFSRCFLITTIRIIQLISIGMLLSWVYEEKKTNKLHDIIEQFDVNPACTMRVSWRSFWAVNFVPVMFSCLVYASLVIVIGMILEYSTFIVSRRGSPTEPEKRTALMPLLHFQILPFSVLRLIFVLMCISMLLHAYDYYECHGNDGDPRKEEWCKWLMTLVICQIIDMGVFIYFWAPTFLKCVNRGGIKKNRNYSLYKKDLNQVCTCFSCCTCTLFGGKSIQTEDLTQVAKTLGNFFGMDNNIDIVSSDITAGFLMLLRVQKQAKYEVCTWMKKTLRYHDIKFTETELNEFEIEEGGLDDEEFDNMMCENDMVDVEQVDSVGHVTTSNEPTKRLPQIIRSSLSELLRTHRSSNKETNSHLFSKEDNLRSCLKAVVKNSLVSSNSIDRFVIAEGARFMRFATAIYTWMMYVMSKPCTGPCQLVCRSCCGLRYVCSQRNTKSEGEICCGWHKIALMQQSGLDDSEIAYAQFQEGVKETPYCIAIDHDWKTIVLAIRGTLSLDDVIADLKLDPEGLEEYGKLYGFDGEDEYAHGGMLDCSLWIYEDLKRHGTLDKLLLGDSPLYPNYRLRVIGHSLGAGCATLLSLMLRGTFPTLRCLAFSPPGCVVTERTAIECKKFTVSYVLNSDIVPRLSLDSMENLRDEVLELIARIKVPKYMVYSTYIKEMYEEDIAESNRKLLHPKVDIPDTAFARALREFNESEAQNKSKHNVIDVKLYPPGNIIHFVKPNAKKTFFDQLISCFSCCLLGTQRIYTPRWVEHNDLREVLISSTMLMDHMPWNVCSALESCEKKYDKEAPILNGATFLDILETEENITT